MSLSMAALTTAALAAPAFAATTANQTVVKTTYAEVPISVTVPTTGTATINPYGLPVNVTLSDNTTKQMTSHQITTQPLWITNNGDVDLSIGATVTTAITSGSELTIVDSKPADDETAKQAMVYLEVRQSALTADLSSALDADEKDTILTDAAGWAASTYSSTAKTQLLLSTDEAVSQSGMVEIKKITDNSGTKKYSKESIVEFRLEGNVTEDPEKAWTTKDGFTATIAFTFKPATTTGGSST
jgi:hypothetical protein